jgi:toxin ParE1/3/4
MSYKVILTEAAYNDLLNIYEYMTFKGVAAYIARNLVRKIQKSILQLDEMPNRCPIYVSKSWFQKPLHKMVVANYLAFYIVDEKELRVSIIRIIYSGRDLDELFK